MAKKQVPLCFGKVIVIVKSDYDVYEKPIPPDIDPNYEWLCSFGIKEAESGKKLNGKVPKYKVLVEDRKDKTLYFWSEGKVKPIPNQKKVKKSKKKYRSGELDLGDPPVGWD